MPAKESPFSTLNNGLVGVALDHRTHDLVVVVDPVIIDVENVQIILNRVASTEHEQRPGTPAISVRVQAGCHTASELLSAAKVIEARSWHLDASSTGYSVALDPHDSTFHVNIETGANDVVAALVGELGDRVTLTYSLGGPVSDVRQDDGERHWGGAAIGLAGGGNYCTSGFTVDTQNSGKAMVTAGHCFRNGDRVTSGNEGYGTAQGESGYPRMT